MGHRVWLYTPAVKEGRSKKLATQWHGPYTIVDKTSSVNYRIQFIGATHQIVVHRNRLKPVFGALVVPNPFVQLLHEHPLLQMVAVPPMPMW